MSEGYFYESLSNEGLESNSLTPYLTDSLEVQNSLWPSYSSPRIQQTPEPHSYIPSTVASKHILSSYVPETYTALYTDYSGTDVSSTEIRNIAEPTATISPSNGVLDLSSSFKLMEGSSISISENYSEIIDSDSTNVKTINDTSYYPYFHTPLMSLLVASSSLTFQTDGPFYQTSVHYSSISPSSFTISDNESTSLETSTVPVDFDHKNS
ncbi:uncharacterized protein CEXT_515511 [Caerostris extrusa]|uniref:Uncharacterized protein n=1 Tax=Caerostris extrusa TaxID=172846 RepID=A0AAV4RI63_CAEEX|nr:uncharacterized protein CEXT_515511 [Caerostris extrusa]